MDDAGVFVGIAGFALEKVGLTRVIIRTKIIDGIGVFLDISPKSRGWDVFSCVRVGRRMRSCALSVKRWR